MRFIILVCLGLLAATSLARDAEWVHRLREATVDSREAVSDASESAKRSARFGEAQSRVASVAHDVQDAAADTADGAKDKLAEAVQSIREAADSVKDHFRRWHHHTADADPHYERERRQTVGDDGSGAAGAVKGTVKMVAEDTKNSIKENIDAARTGVRDAFEAAKQHVHHDGHRN
jgi:uncharacterized protein YjbJ (UPF0337 family)